MNKAFEKILDRLEELKECDLCNGMLCLDCEEKYGGDNCGTRQQSLALDESKAIVQEVAKEYNGGWIPCSEGLPETEDLHNHNLDECTQYLIQRRCGVMDVAHYIKIFREPYFEANSLEIKDVIAWQPLPEPYKEHD